MGTNVFKRVQGLHPGHSVFDLSYEKKFTCDMGQLIPVLCDEVVPGDFIKLGNQAVIRFQPLVSPALHEINMYVHYFFVPYRILWDGWEDFISGGVTGNDTSVLPRWNATVPTINTAAGSLWDYLGFPVGITPTGALPMDFPRRAYARIWNEYYRDETLQPAVLESQQLILNRCWEKDYFTSSLLWQQRGTAPALPVSGLTSAVRIGDLAASGVARWVNNPGTSIGSVSYTASYDPSDAGALAMLHNNTVSTSATEADFNDNVVDLSAATTFDIADLRLAFQIQRWMERNARAGARYTEFLHSHFGVSPRDDRLQRPEYIGGTKSPIIISEVLKTSSTDGTSPQGNLAGHGISISDSYAGKYRVQEYGLIMGLMSVMPRSAYQQGIDRQWLRTTRYDFYFPEFAHLSEQAVITAEIYATAVSNDNNAIWGYQGRYDEMRVKRNMVCGQMRSTYAYWHLGRIFTGAPALNAAFVECIPSKRIFAAPSEPGLIVSFGNIVKAFRPLPISAEPGLIDHS